MEDNTIKTSKPVVSRISRILSPIAILKREERKKQTVIKNEIKKKLKKYKTLENNIRYQNEIIQDKKEKRNELFTNFEKIMDKIISQIKSRPEYNNNLRFNSLYNILFNNLIKEYRIRKKLVVNQLEYITFIKELFTLFLTNVKTKRKEMEERINSNYYETNSLFENFSFFSTYYYYCILLSKECIKELIEINKKLSRPFYDIIENTKTLEKCIRNKKILYNDLVIKMTDFNLKDSTILQTDVINIVKEYIV